MTKTEICNQALALLGHDRAVEDFDGQTDGVYNDQSTEAARCRQFFDVALHDCLAEHDWDFAAVVRGLGLVHGDAYGWARFPMPPDAVRLVEVTDAEGRPMKTRRNRDFVEVQTRGEAARIRYVSDDVDVTALPHKFREALVAQLAFLLAGPMFGSDSKTNSFYQLAKSRVADAVKKETDETAYRGEVENPFTSARK